MCETGNNLTICVACSTGELVRKSPILPRSNANQYIKLSRCCHALILLCTGSDLCLSANSPILLQAMLCHIVQLTIMHLGWGQIRWLGHSESFKFIKTCLPLVRIWRDPCVCGQKSYRLSDL